MPEFIKAFGDDAYFNFTSFVLAAIALMVSVLVAVTTYRQGRRLLTIEEERRGDERRSSKKAQLKASILQPVKYTFVLIVENKSGSSAYNIQLHLDGDIASQHPSMRDAGETIATLSPNGSVEYVLHTDLNTAPPRTAKIQWEDDSGEAGTWEGSLRRL